MPSTANRTCLYASTPVETFFIPNATMTSHSQAQIVLLKLALSSACFELSQTQRKIIQIRQLYAIPSFDDTQGQSTMKSSTDSHSSWDPLRWGYLETDNNESTEVASAPPGGRILLPRKPRDSRAKRMHRAARTRVFANLVRFPSLRHSMCESMPNRLHTQGSIHKACTSPEICTRMNKK